MIRMTNVLCVPPIRSKTMSLIGWLIPMSKPGSWLRRALSLRRKSALVSPAGQVLYGVSPTGASICEGVQASTA